MLQCGYDGGDFEYDEQRGADDNDDDGQQLELWVAQLILFGAS
jgi:hypothetical protein